MVLSNVLRTMATTFPLVDTKHLDQSREEILEIQEMPSRAIISLPSVNICGEKYSRTLPQCNIIPGLCLTETRIPGLVMVTWSHGGDWKTGEFMGLMVIWDLVCCCLQRNQVGGGLPANWAGAAWREGGRLLLA